MRKRVMMALATTAILFAVSACAANLRADLQAEQKNGAQFASWQHMGYSLFRATPKKTTKDDLVAAEREKWWGDEVRVAPMM